jgi:Protein of unknown function (DUF2612)
MEVTKITNHVQQALDRLLQQYKDRPNITGLITAVVQHVQQLENAIFPLDQYRQLLYAYGQQLDNLGEIIGLKRNGLTDAEYLVLLIGTIAENNSDSTAPTLLNVVQLVFQSNQIFYKDPNSVPDRCRPAFVCFGVGNPVYPSAVLGQVEQIIAAAVAGGVAIAYISSFNAAGCFAMSGLQAWTRNVNPPTTPTQQNPWPFGFGDLNNPYVGGGFATLLFSNSKQ